MAAILCSVVRRVARSWAWRFRRVRRSWSGWMWERWCGTVEVGGLGGCAGKMVELSLGVVVGKEVTGSFLINGLVAGSFTGLC